MLRLALPLERSVATMLPRLGSTRGDSRRLEGTTAWLEREDQQRFIARSPLPSSTYEITCFGFDSLRLHHCHCMRSVSAVPASSKVACGSAPAAEQARTSEEVQERPARRFGSLVPLSAGHASPKTTKLYDRTADTISLDEIERIVI